MNLPLITTDRLILRPWKEEDLAPFAAMNCDPRVMEFFEKTFSKEESDAFAQKIIRDYENRDYGFWAVEVKNGASFIGFVGLNYWDLEMDFAPCVDIGWRIAYERWGNGFVTEAAQRILSYGFKVLMLPEIVSMATIQNYRSRRVMERLNMTYSEKDNFYHPKLPKGHPLALRVLYRLTYEAFLETEKREPPKPLGR